MTVGFAHPALLFGVLAATIPIAIHLFFRRRPKPVPFPAIEFILRARRETERRLRLKKILLFSARTLLLAAIATALARPRIEQAVSHAAVLAGPRATAIVLDASGSMRYELGGKTLFERAVSDAREELLSLTPEEPATVVVCGADPPAPEPLSFDRAQVRRILDRAFAVAGHSDLTTCVQAAAQALSASRAQEGLPKRIVIATDLAASAWRLDVPAPTVDSPSGPVRPEVSILDAARGEKLPNHAVVGLEAEPDPAAGPRGFKLTVTLVNHSSEKLAELPLSLLVGMGPDPKTTIRSFTELPAGGAARKSLLQAFPTGGTAAVQVVTPGDALALDDARALVLDVPRDVTALVVDGSPSPVKYRDEAYFLEAALTSPASPVRPHLVDVEGLAREDLSRYEVVFLLNVRSVGTKAPDLQRFVENGGGLFISVGDEIDPDLYARELGPLLPMSLHVEKTATSRVAGGVGAARFAEVDFDHPALSIFTGEAREGLLGTRTFRYLLARPRREGPQAQVLAAFDDGAPALLEGRLGKGRVLLFTSSVDRDWTDWPIRTSFLPAMQRFAAYLTGGLEHQRRVATVVGERRSIVPREGETLAALVGPDGRERPLAELERTGLTRGAEGMSWAPPEPGLWQAKVSVQGEERLEPRLAFAVWPDPRVSDTRRLDPAELTAWFGGESHARVASDARPSGGRELPLWSVLLLLGLAAFLAEGVLIS
ncbi:MAG TPA: BatA domain-containing protein [Anaeromyxobacter sp.]|nr:BatA domain-containing protein [Anaeromyxobacter sp.]